MNRVKVAVIGAGLMGSLHARATAESDRETLVAIADLDQSRAKRLAEQYGASAYYADYKEMLKRENIDAICIATPDSAHAEPVLDCLAANKHVLVEKPLATTLEDSLAILEAEQKSSALLMVNYSHRWAAPYAMAKDMIASGELGKPIMLYARKNDTISVPLNMLRWAEETSPVKFLSSHDIDLAIHFFESEVAEVYAHGAKTVLAQKGLDVYDAVQALVKFRNGAFGTFESAWIYPNTYPNPTDSYIQLVGEKGVVTLDRRTEMIEAATEGAFTYPKISITAIVGGKLTGAFKYAHDHFIDCVLTGKKPDVTAASGHHVTEVTIAIHRSIETGRPVSLPLT